MITIETTRPDSPDADRIVRAYLTDVASRWFGRPATPAEVDQALLDEPFDDLTGDTGLFLVAYDDDLPVGCAGARFTTAEPDDETEAGSAAEPDDTEAGTRIGTAAAAPAPVAELTKVFTLPTHRGTGTASRLIRAVEQHCRERGIGTLRLDTRAELAEACALYERLGFTRVAPFNADPYSDRWYRKTLSP